MSYKAKMVMVATLLVVLHVTGAEPGMTCNWTLEPQLPLYPNNSSYFAAGLFASDTNMLIFGSLQGFVVYDRNITPVGSYVYDNGITFPQRVLVDSNAVFVVYSGTIGAERGLKAFWKNGCTLTPRWEFRDQLVSAPIGMAMDETRLYVANQGNSTVQTFSKDTGALLDSWGSTGTLPEQFSYLADVAVVDAEVYACDKSQNMVKVFTKGGAFLRAFAVTSPSKISVHGDFVYVGCSAGLRVYDRNDNLLWRSATSDALADRRVEDDGGTLIALAGEKFRHLTGPVYRTLGLKAFNQVPVPLVTNVVQRRGLEVLDVDYVVRDADDASVAAYALAFRMPASGGSSLSLTNLIPMRTFVEGTGSNVGTNILVGVSHRLSWDLSADNIRSVIPDYSDIKVAVMARDRREGLLDLHWLEIPAMNGNAPLTINRVPLQTSDFLAVWFWMIASGEPAVSLTPSGVYGAGGDHNGLLLAEGTNTTADGRAFLFQRMNVREASAQEIQLAREAGTPGIVQQWSPLRTPPPADSKVNAIAFVTAPTNGWWVVPLAP
jgi:hypothetical protein